MSEKLPNTSVTIPLVSSAERTQPKEEESNNILDSTFAQNILPYLTLDRLSDQEKVDIIQLSQYINLDQDNPYFIADSIYDSLAKIADTEEDWQQGIIPPKLQEARKLFCASIFEGINNNPDNIPDTYRAFFSFSPNITSYVGGLKDSIELLTIAERTPNNPCSRALRDDIIYETSFSKQNIFYDAIKKATPVQQLAILPTYYKLSQCCNAEDYTSKALADIDSTFKKLSNNDETIPLTKLFANYYSEQIRLNTETEWIEAEPSDEQIAEYENRQKSFMENQIKLHTEYPALPQNQYIQKIAPGIAATLTSSSQIARISNQSGSKQASFLEYNKDNPLNIDQETAALFNIMHNPSNKEYINKTLNVELEKISFESQKRLFSFLLHGNNGRFNNLCNTLHKIDNEDLRIKLLENFVATDFGEDFGDSLLDIVNSDKINPEQTKAILESIISCRKSIDGITSLYDNFDQGQFSEQYKKASNERLTDIITVFREIGKNGSASADLDWAGSPIFDYNSAMEALEYEKKSLEIINGTMTDVLKRKEGSFAEIVISPQKDKMKRTLYSFYSEKYGYCLLYTRPEGASVFDPSFEYGNKDGVEASISFIVNPKDPYSLPNPFRPNLGKSSHENTLNKVSAIRLDREGRTKNMAPNDPNRSSINKNGIVSVDLAAIGDSEETPSGKIARLISIGNKLRAKNEKTSLNHNIAHFDQDKYGPEEGFKKIVDYIDKIATQLCKENPPKNTQESFTRLKKQQHGRKVLKHTT